ncbi:CHAT domain-containing protein [Kitasatospora sp. NPDC096147]|uniref:CHAT domain-containing protein n=1 Tax=Kitasatospora sp. NPDC096147 TaxID=3364093 RepID=UPI0038230915
MQGGPFYDLLPRQHLAQDVLPALSFDAQVYFHCDGCGMYLRSNPAHGAVPDALHRPTRCPSCGTAALEPTLFVFRVQLSCDDCNHQYGTLTTRFFFTPTCPKCASERATQLSAQPHTDLPRAVLDLRDARPLESRAWGLNAGADEKTLSQELRALLSTEPSPDAIRQLVPAALFAGRLATWNHYDCDIWRLRNLEGILLHQFYRRTGVVHAGLLAFHTLAGLSEGVDAPTDLSALGMVAQNAAAAGFSLLNNAHVAVPTEDPEEIRTRSLRLAGHALTSIGADRSLPPEVQSVEIARINYLLGDITRKPTTGPDRLRGAVRYFDLALAEPAISEPLRADITESRTSALGQLRLFAPDGPPPGRWEIDYSRTDWATLPNHDRCIWLHRAAIQLEADGHDLAAEEALRQAADLASTELRTTPDSLLIPTVRHYHRYFDELARLNVRLGSPLTAMEAVEEARALVVLRHGTPSHEAKRQFAKASLTRILTDLLTNPPEPPRFSGFRATNTSEQRPAPLTEAALRDLTDSGWPSDTAFCSFVFASNTASVVVAVPVGDRWQVKGAQWPVDVTALFEGSSIGDLAHAARFRSRRMATYCAKASPILLKGLVPLLRDSGVHRVAISAPGTLSQIPFEALEFDGIPFGEEFEVFLIPSLRSAAAMARRRTTMPGPGRVLVSGYRGSDLPESSVESEEITAMWGDRADLLDQEIRQKGNLLDTISADSYALLHFACHGSFDPSDESRSALHFGAAGDGRPLVLEAGELAGRSLPRSPVVVLSACQSALTSWHLSGDCIGLTGALLRMGARGVVGSRWTVFDDSARVFMHHLHTAIRAGSSPQQAVATTQRAMRLTHAIDDWAAFSYLGLPDLVEPTRRNDRR